MFKRVISIFIVLLLSFSALIFKMAFLNSKNYSVAASLQNSKVISLSKARGTIYDCNMNPITNGSMQYVKILNNGNNPSVIETSETEESANVIGYVKRYSNDNVCTHLIGYINADYNGVCGIEKAFNDYLNEDMGYLKVGFSVDAKGRTLIGAKPELITDDYDIQKGVVLTIDLNMQKKLENILDDNSIDKGCAVIMNVETGEIKALASRPNYSQENVSKYLNETNSPLVNRCFKSYSVGSTFKVVVACAALESGQFETDFSYACKGSVYKNGNIFSCYNKTVHGLLTMPDALNHSCNTYFIELTEELGAEAVLDMAGKLGFGDGVLFASDIYSADGILPKLSDIDSASARANLAFGQGTLSATPIQIACAFSTIADGGMKKAPVLIKGFTDEDGNYAEQSNLFIKSRVISKTTSDKISNMLDKVIEKGAGKTATAQSGWFVNGREVCHCWFAGYYPSVSPKYTVVILKEDGVTGSVDCTPVFSDIVSNIFEKA